MKVSAELNNLKISPRKVRLVTDLIRGLDVEEALLQMKHIVKRSSEPLEKFLHSAIADAENNYGLDRNNLFISSIQVGEGMRLKRWLPRAFGRATLILKRTSRVFLTLEERVEGKNRKSKEQLEKERKEKAVAKDKMRKEILKEREQQTATTGKETPVEKVIRSKKETKKEEESQKGSKGGWVKRMFRRKSV